MDTVGKGSALDELRIVGGTLALELVNTVAPRDPRAGGAVTDYLAGPADLVAWALRVGALTDDELPALGWDDRAGPAALGDVVAVREALYAAVGEVVGGGPGSADAALDVLARRWAQALGRARLAPARPGEPGLAALVFERGPHLVGDRLVHAAVELLRTADAARLGACPVDDGGCGFVFLDETKNGSRRWCSMDDCGSRAKARRLTERRRVGRTAASPGAGAPGSGPARPVVG